MTSGTSKVDVYKTIYRTRLILFLSTARHMPGHYQLNEYTTSPPFFPFPYLFLLHHQTSNRKQSIHLGINRHLGKRNKEEPAPQNEIRYQRNNPCRSSFVIVAIIFIQNPSRTLAIQPSNE
ncbi:hypothetical protein EYC84_004563 [Monilinia fructicola]|uniref:Uncharacterized protein n=1 Tax=Monilinia fructicola TaxID=38448 RepID=A0A5M9K0U0_MONFR|nr:hypothetical protein EYC84_004563 [Monilinia fructicola]